MLLYDDVDDDDDNDDGDNAGMPSLKKINAGCVTFLWRSGEILKISPAISCIFNKSFVP